MYEKGYLKRALYGAGYLKNTLYNAVSSLFNLLVKNCGMIAFWDTTNVVDGVIEDKVGKADRTAYVNQALVGDGSTYVEFPGFTDADLGDNYEIEFDGVYNDTGNTVGLYGFGFSVWERDYAYTTDTTIQVRVSDIALNISHTLAIGERINLRVSATQTGFTVNFNGTEYGPISHTVTTSGEKLVLLTRGGTNAPSKHLIKDFKITNLDTGRTLQLDPTGRDSNGVIKLVDVDTKEFINGQQFISPSQPTVDDITGVSLQDEYGVSVSKARGKNLVEYLESGTLSQADGSELPSVTDSRSGFNYCESDFQYTLSGTENTGGNSTRIYEYDKNKNYIGFITLSDTGGTFTTSQTTKFIRVRYGSTNLSLEVMVNEGATILPYEPYKGYYHDALATQPIPQGDIISCSVDGTLFCYDSEGNRPRADSVGRIKLNRELATVVTPDDATQWSQQYGHITSTDLNLITVNADGSTKQLITDDLANITGNQLFTNEDKTKISFFSSSLAGDCLEKIKQFLKIE